MSRADKGEPVWHLAATTGEVEKVSRSPCRQKSRDGGNWHWSAVNGIRMPWEDRRLLYVVREPFISRHSQAGIVAGMLEAGEELVLESLMPSGGAIFSDGMEADFLQFNSGAIVRVRAAEQRAHLVVS